MLKIMVIQNLQSKQEYLKPIKKYRIEWRLKLLENKRGYQDGSKRGPHATKKKQSAFAINSQQESSNQ